MSRIRYVQNDTRPPLLLDISEADGTPADLTGCTVWLHMQRRGDTVPKSIAAQVTSTPGRAQVMWSAGDLAVAGDYSNEIEILFPDGGRQTIDAQFLINVRPQIA